MSCCLLDARRSASISHERHGKRVFKLIPNIIGTGERMRESIRNKFYMLMEYVEKYMAVVSYRVCYFLWGANKSKATATTAKFLLQSTCRC